ncbi:MAG: hypothetical protein AAGF73_08990 [Actinomycetota bacterium]
MPDTTDIPDSPASAHLADLQRRILDGDTSITGEQVASARADLEVEELRAAGEDARRQAAEEADQEQRRTDAIEALQKHAATGLDDARTAYSQIVEGIDVLQSALAAWNAQRSRLTAAARAAGIAPREYEDLHPIRRPIDEWVQFALDESGGRVPIAGTRSGGFPIARTHQLHTTADRQRLNNALG